MAAAGIGFAILVIFMQMGFYNAVENTALAISSRFEADLVLVSSRFTRLADAGSIARDRLYQAQALDSVVATTPIYFRYADWRVPETVENCRLFAVGFPLAVARDHPPFILDGVSEGIDALKPVGTVLFDTLSQSDCRPANAEGLVEVRGQSAQVVGGFEIGVGFLADGSLITSDDSFSKFFDNYPLSRPHLGLIRLREGTDVDDAAVKLRGILPGDVRVISADELDDMQIRHWVENTAVGNIFTMGTLAGFFVGVVVLYQILSTDIRNQLPYYATLKAMGYSNRMLHGFVLRQAWIFALFGFIPALGLSMALFPFIHSLTLLPIYMTLGLAGFILLLSLGMCTLAASISLMRLQRADPAELF